MLKVGLRFHLAIVLAATAIIGIAQVPHAPTQSDVLKSFDVVVDQPAYAGEPIWIHAPAGKYFIRYPFSPHIGGPGDLADFGCNRVELRYEDQPVKPWQLPGEPIGGAGILCGSSAPAHSPQDRLPLHVLFPILKPGRYSVRWVIQQPNFQRLPNQGVLQDCADSGWKSFTVSQPNPSELQNWLSRLLADPPTDSGLIVGDYIPALVAAAPENRALQAMADQLYSSNEFASALATSALRFFPESRVREAIFQQFKQRGPSTAIGSIIALNKFGVNSDERRMDLLRESYPYLTSHNGAQQAAAVTTIHFIAHFPDNRFPTDSSIVTEADQKILDAAPEIIAANHQEALLPLAVYLGLLSSDRAHELLERFAYSDGQAAEQAQAALLWHPKPGDLAKLAAAMFETGKSDQFGTTISRLPAGLIRVYGDNAIPVVKKAMNDSPYLFVRRSAATELLRRNDPDAFRFFLKEVVNRPWSQRNTGEDVGLIQFLKDTFPADLPRTANRAAVVQFLRARSQVKGSPLTPRAAPSADPPASPATPAPGSPQTKQTQLPPSRP